MSQGQNPATVENGIARMKLLEITRNGADQANISYTKRNPLVYVKIR